MIRASRAPEKQTTKSPPAPASTGEEAPNSQPSSEEDPVARVIQHCGSVAHFFKKFLPGERVMEAVARLDKEIEAGRLPWRPWDDEDEPLTEDGRTGVFRMSAEDEAWVAQMKAERAARSAGILPAGSEASSLDTPDGPPSSATHSASVMSCVGGDGI